MDLLSTKQAASILGVDESRIRQLIINGRLPSMQLGRAHIIKRNDLALVSDRKAGRPKKIVQSTTEASPAPSKKKAVKK